MPRRCHCSSRCKHWARGSRIILPEDRVAALAPYIGILMEVADLFDQDGLKLDPKCGVHGQHLSPSAECSCIGPRYSAVEMVQSLEIHVKAAGMVTPPVRPDHPSKRILSTVG
jgi:hypothetical protein